MTDLTRTAADAAIDGAAAARHLRVMHSNPFFETWDTPFGIPPFERIRPEHFAPAFDHGMAEHLDAVNAIGRSDAGPSFANTIEALERSRRKLDRVIVVLDNLVASQGSNALEAIDLAYSPRLAQHGMRVFLDPDLFRRVKTLYDQRSELGLETDQLRLLERRHLSFIRNGAALGPAQKARMAEISERLATLHTRFGQNVLHDEKAWHLPLSGSDLVGLPDFVRAGARQAAQERGLTDSCIVTLSRSLIEPFLMFSPRRELREAAYKAWIARGAHPGSRDNSPLVREILALRAERARLLGYPSFADYRLSDTMAGSQDAVGRLTAEVWDAARTKAAAERRRLEQIARADGLNGPLQPWDWSYYAEQVRQADYAIGESEIKPYFVLENIQRAAFDTAKKLFGVTFVERKDIPVYHPDVRVFEMQEGGQHAGIFLADPFARPGKRSGAWMSSYRDQESLDGEVTPIVVNNNNFAKATPALLSFNDAKTLFHEFGHALHGLLSRVRYPSQSGTAVRQDFVEFPSQIFEHWLAAPETLRGYARHYETGEPIPDDLIRRLLAARTFNQGFATIEYTASAILDMELHAHPNPENIDVAAFEREVLARIGMPPEIGMRHRPAHFQHLFSGGGYAAGYYSYLWAEVLDADGFLLFEDAGDLFDPELAARLRLILESGDTRDPMEIYVAFRGHAPSTDALLRNRDLVPTLAPS